MILFIIRLSFVWLIIILHLSLRLQQLTVCFARATFYGLDISKTPLFIQFPIVALPYIQELIEYLYP